MAWTEPQIHPDPQLQPKRTFGNLLSTFSSAIVLLTSLGAFAGPCRAGPPQPARPPLLSGQPFIIFWGVLDSSCPGRPDPTSFGMEREGRVAIFYEDTLGDYPYFIDKNTPVNGGLPQNTRLDGHIQKTQQDLETALTAPRYLGLGVLRWAEWVPQWARSRDKQPMYLEASRNLMKSFFPNWTPEEVEKWSRGGTSGARLYLSGVIKEALRVSSLAGADFDLPVFPLIRSVYASTKTFLSQADLVNAIGESAAMGTAGVVIWDRSETKTERECQDLAEFVRKVLGPYSSNVTAATQLCSASLCQGKGRCVRQNPSSSAYLHLPPPSTAAGKAEAAKATEQPDTDTKTVEPDPAEIWKKDFQCQWYKTADGDVSDRQPPKDGVGGTTEGNSEGAVGNAEGAAGNSEVAAGNSEVAAGNSEGAAPSAGTTTEPTRKSSSETKFAGTGSPGTESPTPSLKAATDTAGISPVSGPNLTILLLVLAASLCLSP
ncbi:glyco_hydro_56 domain-containing protein isoform X2 [Cololabis saira]|uniref:glyco_hydro_56 domain-containing protein isoform X2 n=1 Tax=Cololabis saira TaxID=129043 RepID=UPI002AD4C418|nr:glyco_hydro_56 domain-containing protein isoform X2 [Cololabis saira]